MAATVLEFSSIVSTPRAEVWAVVSTMNGVNKELGPWIRMTHPEGADSLADLEVVPGEVLFESWLLGFGFIPFDRHSLALERLDVGYGFVEESTSWMQRRWRHERRLSDHSAGCTVVDRLTVEPRLATATPVVVALIRRMFRHRHRQLQRRFGAA